MGLKTKRIGIISGLLVLIFILVASASAQPPIPIPPLPPILSNFTITPPEIECGDNVTIGLDIENIDSQSFTYIVTMKIENVNDPPPTWPPYNVTMAIYVELGAYESKAISHTTTLDTVGDFNVTVDGMTGSFTVKAPLKPAEFVVSDLTVSPTEVESGEEVTISVTVTNVGEEEGVCSVEFEMDGAIVGVESTSLVGGASSTITIVVRDAPAGVHDVQVVRKKHGGALKASFTVKPKPSFWDKISGFPYESIIIGLIAVIIILWHARKF